MRRCVRCPRQYHIHCLSDDMRQTAPYSWECPSCIRKGMSYVCQDCPWFRSKYYSSYRRHKAGYCRGSTPIITVKDIADIASTSTASNTELAKILMKIKNILGPLYFEGGVRRILRQNLNSFLPWMESSIVTVKDVTEDSGSKQTVMANVRDISKTAAMIANKRNVTNPHFSINIDGGGEKLIVTLQVYDNDNDDETQDSYSDGGERRSVIVSGIDHCPESRETIEQVLKPVQELLARDDIDLNGDLSALADFAGQSINIVHNVILYYDVFDQHPVSDINHYLSCRCSELSVKISLPLVYL